jgi:hypothetical protein
MRGYNKNNITCFLDGPLTPTLSPSRGVGRGKHLNYNTVS